MLLFINSKSRLSRLIYLIQSVNKIYIKKKGTSGKNIGKNWEKFLTNLL